MSVPVRIRSTKSSTTETRIPLIDQEEDEAKIYKEIRATIWLTRINTLGMIIFIIWITLITSMVYEDKKSNTEVTLPKAIPGENIGVFPFTLTGDSTTFVRYPPTGTIEECNHLKRYLLCCETNTLSICAHGRGASRTANLECIMQKSGEGYYASVFVEHPDMMGARCLLYCWVK